DPDWRSPLSLTPEAFASQCAWLERRRVVGLDQAVAAMDASGRLSRGTIALTFDDGLSGVYDHAFPILRSHKLPATVFLVAQPLSGEGRAVDWVDTPPPHPLTPLSLGQVQEMRESGVCFGSHSYAHHDLRALGEDECLRDLRQSRELLESLLGERVRFLAYP